VGQHLDAVKTEGSCRVIPLDPELLQVFQSWKQQTEFREAGDWIFASPVKLGRLPVSYTGLQGSPPKRFHGYRDRPDRDSQPETHLPIGC